MHTIRDDLRATLARSGVDLLPMPQVASRIMALAFDPSSEAAQLADLIQRDPSLAGQLMRVANAPLYRGREQIESLQQAITWLGMGEVQNLAVALAVRGQVFKATGHEVDVDEMWRESLATAMWAQEIGRARDRDSDVAYLCGLLHAIGRVAVVRVLSTVEAQQRMVCDARTFSLLLDEFEQEFAVPVLNEWQLPRRVSAAVLGWRSYERVSDFREDAAVTHAARQLATASLHPALLQVDYLLSNPVFAELQVDQAALEGLLQRSDEIRAFVMGF